MAKNPRLATSIRPSVKMPAPQIKVLFCPLGGKAKISRILSTAGMRAMVEGELVLLYFKDPSAKNGAKKSGGRGSKKR